MKKTLIVSPYLDHLGGGERYMLSLANVLESLGHEIYFAWDNLTEITNLAAMFGLTLSDPKLAPAIKNLYITHHPLSMYQATRPYDLVVYLSDGSIPLLGGKRNILHLQVPFHGVRGRSWKNAFKKQFIHSIIVNSRFTKTIVDAEYGINSTVIYPPVLSIDPSTKSKTILSVGRFEPSLNTKHQDILIKAFCELTPQLPGWKLVLAGASSNEDWVSHLRSLATGLPIDILTNVSYSEISQLYAESWIYWHAAGYGVDEVKNPELTEHFGISTVEAISALCIPLVVPYGGQKEIVTNTSLHWTTISELIVKTLDIISAPPPLTFDTSLYSIEKFSDQLKKIL